MRFGSETERAMIKLSPSLRVSGLWMLLVRETNDLFHFYVVAAS